MNRLRCGVIGAGWWATYAHIPALIAHPRAELIAIQKRDPAQARRVADDFGVLIAVTTANELLAIDGLRAVVIASPAQLHYSQAIDAIARGMHVLLEKPMTITAAEARHLVGLAADKGTQLLISCPWHYTAHGREARRLIQCGALGEVRMISILMTNPVAALLRGESTIPTHGEPYMSPHAETYSDPHVAGGGQIFTQGSHVTAYLNFLTGARAARVFGRFQNDGAKLDIYDVLNIEMTNGCLVSLASTGATPASQRDYEVRIFGTDALLFLDLWRGHMRLISQRAGTVTEMPPLSAEQVYPERSPAQNLVDAALGNAPNLSPGELGLAAMEIIEAACESARSQRDVVVR